eukprot:TRINITY_DN1183_c0_g1_i1.p1 TRINITY_DN1183_c0_g1~~TRINITY_DN1183_c0_g1_i1.p1  ORF type:complete len:356 (-),score=62.92 TRINITY_DN1183_c0_g1_i1:9-1076(-)
MYLGTNVSTMNAVKFGDLSYLYRDDQFLCEGDSLGCFSEAMYSVGGEVIEDVVNRVQSEIESYDSFQGFQYIHSTGGGTGSGLTSLVNMNMMDYYPDKVHRQYSVFPGDECKEIYNTVFSMHYAIENSCESFILDNDATRKWCLNQGNTGATVVDINSVIVDMITDISVQAICGSMSFLKSNTALVPFPRLHFYSPSYFSHDPTTQGTKNEKEIVDEIFWPTSLLNSSGTKGKYLSSTLLLRGENISEPLFSHRMHKWRTENPERSSEFLSLGYQVSVCPMPGPSWSPNQLTGTLVSNSTSISSIFKPTLRRFQSLFNNKEQLHQYTQTMDELEFQEAESNLQDLILEYNQYEQI